METKFYQGTPIMLNHVAAADIAAGEVVIAEGKCFVAHLAIKTGKLGSLAGPSGSAAYRGTKAAGQAWAQGEAVYWDDTGNEFTTVSTANTLFGYAAEAALAGDAEGAAVHGGAI